MTRASEHGAARRLSGQRLTAMSLRRLVAASARKRTSLTMMTTIR